MATKADTFERKEKKYLLSDGQAKAIKEGISSHMRLDDYGATRIDSLYLDTPDRSLICRSLEKPLYKEKVRVRSYGAFSEAQLVFLEIKKKFKGIVYKRRVRMSKQAYDAYRNGAPFAEAQSTFPINPENPEADLSWGSLQISRELDAFFDRYPGLEPSMLISCMREAYCPLDPADTDCVDRITFDEDISYVDLCKDGSTQRRLVAGTGQVVMEIKCAGGYPVWLCRLLSEIGASPRSFSKYGNAYKRVLAEQGNVDVSQSPSGKVSIKNIPLPNRLKTNDGEVLIGPSEGYEIVA